MILDLKEIRFVPVKFFISQNEIVERLSCISQVQGNVIKKMQKREENSRDTD